MRIYRKGSLDVKEMWGEAEVINHLKCDEMKAKQILDEVRAACRISGYGLVEKERIIEYLAEKERLQREREARITLTSLPPRVSPFSKNKSRLSKNRPPHHRKMRRKRGFNHTSLTP